MGLLLGFLFLIQLIVSDRLIDDVRHRKVIWTRRQTRKWREMVRDLDFAAEIYALQLEMQGEAG